jgi:hypothetical protein
MSTSTLASESRVHRGVPAGGQYSAHDRDGDALTLTIEVATSINDRFPLPQANNLEKVCSVMDAVLLGANSAEAIGETLGLHTREGAYYGDAAGYLGLVDTASGADQKTYELTALGEQLADASTADRVEMLRNIVATVPAVQIYAEHGEAGVQEMLSEAGLGETTVGRRSSTISSWYMSLAVEKDIEFTALAESERQNSNVRGVEAAIRLDLVRRARALAAPTEKVAAVCTNCFMALPVSGICDC